MKRTTTLWLARLGCLLLAASSAFAQSPEGASSFESLGSGTQLRNGERIEITDVAGKKLSARFESISGSVLTARSGKSTLEFTKADIAKISRRKPERWWDGMLIGMGVGAATGLASALSSCRNDSECAYYTSVVLVPTFAGGGAGIGALIDSLFHKNETVYSRDSGSLLHRLKVSPVAGKSTAGVRLSLSF
jgi:hypothetical protein